MEGKQDKTKRRICAMIGIGVAFVLTAVIFGSRAGLVRAKTAQLQESLAGEVFRFHVLANSDSSADQEVKLQVRDAVLSYMKESLGEGTSAAQTKAWAEAHIEELNEIAGQTLKEHGFPYRARSEVTASYFPEKRYGDVTFPQGEYEALRITLGKGEGHNWWCVLYPNLCFLEPACAVVSEEGKEELKNVLDEDEYEMVTAASKFKVKWFFLGNQEEDER